MKRRRFLQLAASAAAAAVVRRSSALSCSAGQIPHPAAADVLTLSVGEPLLAAMNAPRVGIGGSGNSPVEPDRLIEMLLEKRSDSVYQWTVDGRPHVAETLFLHQGRRYRLRMMNATGGIHTVHLQHHRFEIARLHQVPVSGIFKDSIRLGRYNVVEADVVMSRPGPLLLHYPSS
jgi:FtsP/CotA-like multicopper oxidase with cupredoxin domain